MINKTVLYELTLSGKHFDLAMNIEYRNGNLVYISPGNREHFLKGEITKSSEDIFTLKGVLFNKKQELVFKVVTLKHLKEMVKDGVIYFESKTLKLFHTDNDVWQWYIDKFFGGALPNYPEEYFK